MSWRRSSRSWRRRAWRGEASYRGGGTVAREECRQLIPKTQEGDCRPSRVARAMARWSEGNYGRRFG
jgi:hypothetical protein